MRDNMKRSIAKEIYEWVETFLVALTAVIFVFTFLVKFVTEDIIHIAADHAHAGNIMKRLFCIGD